MGQAITKSVFVHRIMDLLLSFCFPAHHYAGHSFRIATAALMGIRLNDPETGQVAQCCLAAVHTDTKGTFSHASAFLVQQARTAQLRK